MRENQLNELQGVSILTKEFFNKLIRRIECTKPLAGAGIAIKEEENGYKITSNLFDEAGGGSGSGSGSGYTKINITICKDGSPVSISVLGFEV